MDINDFKAIKKLAKWKKVKSRHYIVPTLDIIDTSIIVLLPEIHDLFKSFMSHINSPEYDEDNEIIKFIKKNPDIAFTVLNIMRRACVYNHQLPFRNKSAEIGSFEGIIDKKSI